MTARFITFEGIEGVGKSTQLALAGSWAQRQGIAHIMTREPGGTALAEKIRDLVLAPREEDLPPTAELLLMFAARAVHWENRIQPALMAGQWVFCDRFTDATFAYQGAGRGLSTASIAALETQVLGSRQPDLTFLLDMPVEQGMRRVQQRGLQRDRFESERVEFFERVRRGYLDRARAAPQRFVVIDASGTADAVHGIVSGRLESLLAAG